MCVCVFFFFLWIWLFFSINLRNLCWTMRYGDNPCRRFESFSDVNVGISVKGFVLIIGMLIIIGENRDCCTIFVRKYVWHTLIFRLKSLYCLRLGKEGVIYWRVFVGNSYFRHDDQQAAFLDLYLPSSLHNAFIWGYFVQQGKAFPLCHEPQLFF